MTKLMHLWKVRGDCKCKSYNEDRLEKCANRLALALILRGKNVTKVCLLTAALENIYITNIKKRRNFYV